MSNNLEVALKINVDKKEGETNLQAFNRTFNDALKDIGKSGEEVEAFEKLATEIKSGKKNVEDLDAATAALYQQFKDGSQLAADRDLLGLKQHITIQQEIDETRAAYDRLKKSGTLTGEELAQAALKTEDRIKELKHQTNGWTDSLENAKASIAGLAAAGTGLTLMAGEAIEFEAAMSDVKKVVDGTDEQLGDLASRIKELSTELPIGADGLAQIAAAGGQLGVPIEKLETFIQLSAKMATAFNLTAEEAGEAVAKLSNVFNLPLENVEALGDAINTLGNTTAAKESQILDFLTRVGGTANQFGLTAEQASALGATLIGMGSSSEVAATGVNALLTKLQTANTQGSDFKSALKSMGVSATDLAAEIRANPQQALSEFLQQLDKLDQQAKAEILSKLFGQEYQDDIARLLNGLNQYDEALIRVSDSGTTAGAMQKEFAARMETTEAQIQLLKNGVEAVAINIGTLMLPALNDTITALGDVTAGIAAFVEENPGIATVATTIATVVASAAALKTLMLSLGVVGQKAMTAIIAETKLANSSMTDLVSQTGKVETAIRAAGAAWAAWEIAYDIGDYLYNNFEAAQKVGNQLAEVFTKLVASVRLVMDAISDPSEMTTAWQSYTAELDRIDRLYDQMYEEIGKLPEQQAKATDKVKETTAAVEENSQAIENNKGKVVSLASAFQELGLDVDVVMGNVTEDADKAAKSIGTIAAELTESGKTAQEQSQIMEAALLAAIPTTKTNADIDLITSNLNDLGDQGILSAAGVERVTTALQDQQNQINKTILGLQDLEEAGKKSAEGAREAVAATDQLNQTMERTGSDVQSLAQGLASWFMDVRSQLNSLSSEAESLFLNKLGMDADPALSEIDQLKQGINDALSSMRAAQRDNLLEFDTTGVNRWENAVISAKNATVAAYNEQKIEYLEYIAALKSGEGVTENLISRATYAANRMALLGSENLATLRNAIASATAQLEQMTDTAESTLLSLQNQLSSLQDDQDAIDERNYLSKKAELEAAIAEAKAAGNQEAIDAYKEALSTLEEIRKEQKKAAKEASSDSSSSTTSTSSASSAGSSSESGTSTTASSSDASTSTVRTIRIEFSSGSTVDVVDNGSDETLISELESLAQRSGA